jgi:DNA (cytosine-5)-methyltransferase 1
MKAITKNKRKISDEIIDNNNLTIKSNFKDSKKIPKINLSANLFNSENSNQLQFQFDLDSQKKYNFNKLEKLKFIDLFAGIGGIRIALENAGFECVFSNDFDKNCKVTFDYNFANKNSSINQNHELFLSDISKIQNQQIPACDILAGGFPCQPFSIAGYRQGFNDQKGRGNVFFDITRIISDKKPQVILLENVKNLKSHDNGETIKIIYQELKNLGYHVCDKVMNSLDYGNLPQNRERIYIIAFKDKNSFEKFNFPNKISLSKTIQDCLEKEVDEKYYYTDKPLYSRIKDDVNKKFIIYQWRRKYVRENKSSACPTLTANMGMGGHNVPIILDDKGIRKLTPRECANFQGFPADYKLPKIADSALYKQFGNSVAISVVERIAFNIRLAIEGVSKS